MNSTHWQYLHADVTPRDGLDAVLLESPYRQTPVGDWSLHSPDGAPVPAVEIELTRELASWTWEGAFEGPGRDPGPPSALSRPGSLTRGLTGPAKRVALPGVTWPAGDGTSELRMESTAGTGAAEPDATERT